MTTEKKCGIAALLPMMAGFFVMGFADIVGPVVNQVNPSMFFSVMPVISATETERTLSESSTVSVRYVVIP